MAEPPLHLVTGAFGYSGRYIARALLARGDRRVGTVTASPERPNDFAGRLEVRPLRFDDPTALVDSLRGAEVLYNTYWVRFNAAEFSHRQAVDNTLALFAAAREAGVRRVVHTSITNPSLDSPFEYFRGKAQLEAALCASGLAYAILRPAVLFGGAGILINNIAWCLRRLPVMGVFGDGEYGLQPIHVEDFAALAVVAGEAGENQVIDAVGPERFTYRELVSALGEAIGCRRPIVRVSPGVGYLAARLLGRLVGDVLLTREEIGGLTAGLLAVDSPPVGEIKLSVWAREHADELGKRYFSEMARRHDRRRVYGTE